MFLWHKGHSTTGLPLGVKSTTASGFVSKIVSGRWCLRYGCQLPQDLLISDVISVCPVSDCVDQSRVECCGAEVLGVAATQKVSSRGAFWAITVFAGCYLSAGE